MDRVSPQRRVGIRSINMCRYAQDATHFNSMLFLNISLSFRPCTTVGLGDVKDEKSDLLAVCHWRNRWGTRYPERQTR